MSAGWPVQLPASAFNKIGQYASSPGFTAYYYAELIISSRGLAATIETPTKECQAELT